MLPFMVSSEPIDHTGSIFINFLKIYIFVDITKDFKMIKNSFQENLKNEIIYNEKNQQIGKVLCSFYFIFQIHKLYLIFNS